VSRAFLRDDVAGRAHDDPSSTSQSDFFESFGKTRRSFRPLTEVTAFWKTIGSDGSGRFPSLAWSA
jgi:hypothetical protein